MVHILTSKTCQGLVNLHVLKSALIHTILLPLLTVFLVFSLSYYRTFKAKSSSRLAILNIKGTIFLSIVGCEKRCGTIYFPVTVVKYILPEA